MVQEIIILLSDDSERIRNIRFDVKTDLTEQYVRMKVKSAEQHPFMAYLFMAKTQA